MENILISGKIKRKCDKKEMNKLAARGWEITLSE
jgi:hypothetical protein